jgi:putative component of membrane protein insertase Oxa1/YidC/SpoIIIJ protein YidD
VGRCGQASLQLLLQRPRAREGRFLRLAFSGGPCISIQSTDRVFSIMGLWQFPISFQSLALLHDLQNVWFLALKLQLHCCGGHNCQHYLHCALYSRTMVSPAGLLHYFTAAVRRCHAWWEQHHTVPPAQWKLSDHRRGAETQWLP